MALLTLTDEGEIFLKEWLDGSPYITAHTSGSTGKPKEIRLLKKDMLHSAYATNAYFNITDKSVLVCPLSANYIAGKMMIVRGLVAGCRLVMVRPSNAVLSEDYGDIDLLPIVPSQISGLLTSGYPSKIKKVIIGGAPVSAIQEQAILAANRFSAYATYGMTETCSHIAVRKLGSALYQAMPGVTFGVDGRGCLKISSSGFSFTELQTNDIVELHDEQHFRWLGRADNVVISGGVKIFPEEIEHMLAPYMHYPFYFTGESDEKWGQRLVMKVAAPGDIASEVLLDEIKGIVSVHLSNYKKPKAIVLIPELPLTENGKLRRT